MPVSGVLAEHVIKDYASLRLSLKAHPLALLRDRLASKGILPARQLWGTIPGRQATVAGLVLIRQRPGSAKGVTFVTLEDETGFANLVVWPSIFERRRAVLLTARLLAAAGPVQRQGRVIHLVAERLADLTAELDRLRGEAIDPGVIDDVMSHADEIRREARDARTAMPEGRNFR